MHISEFDDYREFLREFIKNSPKKGRGQASKIASHLGISAVLVSQVLKGDRNLNAEQAFLLTDYLSLSDMERKYFLNLVDIDRSGNYLHKQFLKEQNQDLKDQMQQIKNRVKDKKNLDEKAKSIYYSNWFFVAIRLLINNPDYGTVEALSEKTGLNVKRIREVLDFLLEHDLIGEGESGFVWKGTSTHVDESSALVINHHRNWRRKAEHQLERDKNSETEIYFSSPMIIDKECAKNLRKKILQFIEENQKAISDAPSEDLYCMNLDLFEVT